MLIQSHWGEKTRWQSVRLMFDVTDYSLFLLIFCNNHIYIYVLNPRDSQEGGGIRWGASPKWLITCKSLSINPVSVQMMASFFRDGFISRQVCALMWVSVSYALALRLSQNVNRKSSAYKRPYWVKASFMHGSSNNEKIESTVIWFTQENKFVIMKTINKM